MFSCSSDVSYPSPSLIWSLDGQGVTRDAQQTDNVENDGGIASISVLKLKPTMGGHEHVVECFVGGYDVSKKAQFVVEGKQKLQNSVDFVMLFISELLGEESFEDRDY